MEKQKLDDLVNGLSITQAPKVEDLRLIYLHERVETKEALDSAINRLQDFQYFAVDCEGLDLGRSGPLTILTIKGINESY
jgi:hypothetical protein